MNSQLSFKDLKIKENEAKNNLLLIDSLNKEIPFYPMSKPSNI
jgi:hypothetical protein